MENQIVRIQATPHLDKGMYSVTLSALVRVQDGEYEPQLRAVNVPITWTAQDMLRLGAAAHFQELLVHAVNLLVAGIEEAQ